MEILPALRREIHPLRDWQSYLEIKRAIHAFNRTWSTRTAARRVCSAARRRMRWAYRRSCTPCTVRRFIRTRAGGRARVFRACERFAAERCDALVSVADAMTDLMVNAGVAPREKFTTIYSGMEVEPFLAADEHRAETRAALGYRDEHVVVGKIARLFHLKGHEYLVRAAEQAVRSQPNLRFLLVGDGILARCDSRASAPRRTVRSFSIHRPGSARANSRAFGAMDVVVHTSLREGLARVLPQALIAGKPVISYDVDGAAKW